MNHCFAKTEIYAVEHEILFAKIFANQHLFKTTLDTKHFNPFLQWTRHVMWLFGNCPQTSTFCNIFRSYLRQISNIHLFSLNLEPLWNKNSWHLCSDCQSCHYQLSRFLPISRLRGLPTNFKFLVFLRVFYICCRLANESTRSNRWDWYILWILVSYLYSSSVKKPNLISERCSDSWFIFSEKVV